MDRSGQEQGRGIPGPGGAGGGGGPLAYSDHVVLKRPRGRPPKARYNPTDARSFSVPALQKLLDQLQLPKKFAKGDPNHFLAAERIASSAAKFLVGLRFGKKIVTEDINQSREQFVKFANLLGLNPNEFQNELQHLVDAGSLSAEEAHDLVEARPLLVERFPDEKASAEPAGS